MANNIGDLGFNGSGSRFNSRFGVGEPILAKQLNDLASGIQASLTTPYLGEGQSISFTSGGTLITPVDSVHNEKEKNPFDVSVSKVKVGGTYEYRLKTIMGVCPAFVIQGFIDESPDGAMTMIQNIVKPNIYPTDSRVTGTDTNSIYMDNGGYLKLTPDNNYMLFLFLLQPGQVDSPNEFRAIQLVLSKIGSGQPNSIIDNLLAKCFFTGGSDADVNMQYSQSWCIRDNIAQFVWDATNNRFVIYQYTNTPKLFYPVFNKTGTGAGDTFTNPMIAAFSGYTKDLEGVATLYTPAQQDKFPPLHS